MASLVFAALAANVPAQAAVTPATKLDPRLGQQLTTATSPLPVIVQFASTPTQADGRAMLQAGFGPGLTRYTVVPAVYGVAPASAIRRLASNPRVTHIEPDTVLPYTLDRSTIVTRSKPLWDATYALDGDVHTDGITGRGVGVAVIDSGIDGRHPDLLWKPLADATSQPAKTVLNLRLLFGRPTVVDGDAIDDVFGDGLTFGPDVVNSDNTGGHGTHVAGIAAGNGRGSDGRFTGTAPGAELIGLGAGDTLVVHSALAAFDWLHHHHAEYNVRVVNNSWGGAGEWDPDRALTKAIRRISNEDGVVVVFAAGNSGGTGTDVQTNVWGNIPEVIQVANYYDKSGWLDDTSSRGLATNEDTWPDVAAPGSQIISTAALGGPVTYFGSAQDALIADIFGYDEPVVVPAQIPSPVYTTVGGRDVIVGDYASFSGTSMASPAVAGVVALVLEANPALTPPEVRTLLRATANGLPGRSYAADGYALGKGVVDAAEAVAVALKMREGMTMANALLSASLDLDTSPVEVNLGTGPVGDNTVPLLPPTPATITGNPQMFHGGAIDPAVLTGTYGFAPGEPVGLLVRSLTSHDPSAPLTVGEFTGELVIRKASDGSVAFGPFAAEVGSDTFGMNMGTDWTIPVDAAPGSYTFDSSVTITATSTSYPVASLPFFIGAPT